MSDLANSIDWVSKTAMCGRISIDAAIKAAKAKALKYRQRTLILHALPCQQATFALKATNKWVP